MPKICKYRPNRRTPRRWDLKGSVRVVRRVQDLGATNVQVMGAMVIATNSLNDIESVYRALKITKAITKIVIALFFWKRIGLVIKAAKTIIQEILDRLDEFPPLSRRSTSIWRETLQALQEILAIFGGIVAVVKVILGFNLEWLDEIRNAAYAYKEEVPPEFKDLPEEWVQIFEEEANGPKTD